MRRSPETQPNQHLLAATPKRPPPRNKLTNQSTQATMSEALTLRGVLKGHSDWVTALATTSEDPGMIISASRDKTCLVSVSYTHLRAHET